MFSPFNTMVLSSYLMMCLFSVLVLIMSFYIFSTRFSLLGSLITLEVLMFLAIYSYIPMLSFEWNSYTLGVMFLCFASASAAIGLSLLMSVRRMVGSDFVSSI
uniref:NADH dehydrogenase subunit 4L n=1 Tax=Satsuma myomphala TaxID=358001 RepID=UPI00300195C5